MKINHNKSYILGLFIGGGKISKDDFLIELPYKKWGMDPKKMNIIAADILRRIAKLFKNEYFIDISYELGNSKWFLKPVTTASLEKLKKDLNFLGFPTKGFLLKEASLTIAKEKLKGINAESFLSGIFDSRASITLSHRRFNDDAPVVSIEIPGSTNNFKFVVQLCSWLTDMGSVTDQILYNHPNQHAAANPNYSGWKKGFKIRFLIKSFLAKHSFALQAKSIDAITIEKNQRKEEQTACLLRKINSPSPVSIHTDINSDSLPPQVKNKLFFHYFHFCAALGCKHAPYEEVEKLVNQYNKYIAFFPRLIKGTIEEVERYFEQINSDYFGNAVTIKQSIKISNLIKGKYKDYYSLQQLIAFLFSKELNGKRHVGSMKDIVKRNLENDIIIYSFKDKIYEPILLLNPSNNRAGIISHPKSKKNQDLVKNNIQVKGLDVSL